MNKLIKSFVDSYSPLLYHFNWQLYLNKETASKMTEEALSLFLQGMALKLDEFSEGGQNGQFQNQVKLYQISYELFLNMKERIKPEDDGRWSHLRPLERSALFLKHKCSLSYKDMESIFHAPAATLIGTTHQAREFMLEGRSDLC